MKIKELLKAEGIEVSIHSLCKICGISRTAIYREPLKRSRYRMDSKLCQIVREFLERYPTTGVKKLTYYINQYGKLAKKINWKSVYRILKIKGWIQNKRRKGFRPRVKASRSLSQRPNQRWALDTTHFPTKRGWCHMTAVIDCYDRSIVGWRTSYSGKTKVAVAAFEDAILSRRPDRGLIVRSDNGLVFSSKEFRMATNKNGCIQEFITPYTPEQNGMIERWFRSLKEDCIWLRNFDGLNDATRAIAEYIEHYNKQRPHWSLGFKTPEQVFYQLAA
jgi:putative transposase